MLAPVEERVITRADGVAVTVRCLRFAAYPNGARLLARVLAAFRPLKPTLDGALSSLRASGIKLPQLAGLAANDLPAALSILALNFDASSALFSAVDVLGAITADDKLVADLLTGTSIVTPNGTGSDTVTLSTEAAIKTAIAYDYALLGKVLLFSLEVNFKGPLLDGLARRLSRPEPATEAA